MTATTKVNLVFVLYLLPCCLFAFWMSGTVMPRGRWLFILCAVIAIGDAVWGYCVERGSVPPPKKPREWY